MTSNINITTTEDSPTTEKKIKLDEEASQLPQKNSNTETTPVSTPINKTKLEGYENGGSPTKVKQDPFIVLNTDINSLFFPSLASNNDIKGKDDSEALDLSTSNGLKQPKIQRKQDDKPDNDVIVLDAKSNVNSTSDKIDSSPKAGPSNSFNTFPIKRKIPKQKTKTISNSNLIPDLRETIGASTSTSQPFFSSMQPSVASNTQIYANPPPLWDMIINFPKVIATDFPKFQSAMCLWKYHKIDGCDLPVVKRVNMELVPASVVHVKLLPRFASNVVQKIPESILPKLVSYKMTVAEAWMLNFVNATSSNFSLGLQIFMNGDDLVELKQVEKYYWMVKKIHLEHLLMVYGAELPPGSVFENRNLVGAIINLKKTLVDEIKQINYRQADMSLNIIN